MFIAAKRAMLIVKSFFIFLVVVLSSIQIYILPANLYIFPETAKGKIQKFLFFAFFLGCLRIIPYICGEIAIKTNIV